jgi:mono/diheme cytochrome c family protein
MSACTAGGPSQPSGAGGTGDAATGAVLPGSGISSGGASSGGDSGATSGSSGAEDGGGMGGIVIGGHPVDPTHLEHIPPYPQPTKALRFEKTDYGKLTDEWIAPDADLGWWYLVNGDYVRVGPALRSFMLASPALTARDTVPGRDGDNQKLAYLFNAVKTHDGAEVAAPNCLSCHFSHIGGKMVPGLGRANHFVKTDASGSTINLVAIIGASIFTGDIFSTTANGLGFFQRLFGGALHSHFMDIFADLASRHDPKTLKWTGELSFDPDSHFEGWVDFPAWWNLNKKNALYSSGTGRGIKGHHLQFMSWFSVDGIEEATKIQNNFLHVQKYIEQLKAPKYDAYSPVKIDRKLVAQGEEVFNDTCTLCHGTYAEKDEDEFYPNFRVHYDEVGTDPNLADNHWIYPASDWYDSSWYGKDKHSWFDKVKGYMAPPLDGVWATAPYFHNGSVPTLEGVLDPSKRPAAWTSNMSDDDYDFAQVGWMNKPLDLQGLSLDFSQGVYDTRRPGYSNRGHTYAAHLSATEKKALLEYLKSL